MDEVKGETGCHGGFPSTKTHLAIIEDSLHHGNDNEAPVSSASSSINSSSKVLLA